MSKRRSKASRAVEIHEGSGSVYADLGYRDAEEMLVKATLVRKISEIIRSKGLTQVETARILGLTQPKVSALLRRRISPCCSCRPAIRGSRPEAVRRPVV